jgi:hypothetical protein
LAAVQLGGLVGGPVVIMLARAILCPEASFDAGGSNPYLMLLWFQHQRCRYFLIEFTVSRASQESRGPPDEPQPESW